MKLKTFLALLFCIFHWTANAYDVDTHFYGTYAMARHAGLNHAVAAKLATSAQWMDESYISDPTSMIFLPVTGIKKRRLLHFPGSRITGKLNAQAQQSILKDYQNQFSSTLENLILTAVKLSSGKDISLDGLNFKSEVSKAHPFSTALLAQGLKEGNLMRAGASLHVLQDSFAHAGAPAEEGHGPFWHWPDRPFKNPGKYWEMVDSVFAALVAIRNQLPTSVLDCKYMNLKSPFFAGVPNCQAPASALSESFKKIPEIDGAVRHNILVDPEYVRTAVLYVTDLAIDVGYLKVEKQSAAALVNSINFDGKTDGFQTFSGLLENWMTEASNFPQLQPNGQHCPVSLCLEEKCALQVCSMLSDMGQLNCQESSLVDLINSRISHSPLTPSSCVDATALRTFANRTTRELLLWHVPIPLDDTHLMEFEDDSSPVRKKEMEIRVRKMQSAIKTLFGIDLEFIPNNSSDHIGLWREFYLDPVAEAVIPDNGDNRVYATFNLNEKRAWDIMIFEYLFPNLRSHDLEVLIQVGAAVKNILDSNAAFVNEAQGVIAGKGDPSYLISSIIARSLLTLTGGSEVKRVISLLDPISADFLSDLFLTNMRPAPENMHYANPAVLRKHQVHWPIFLSNKDAWTLDDLK